MIGEMRHRITVQRPTYTQDAGKGRAVAWTNVETVWGEVKPISAREQLHGLGIVNPILHRITIRYRSDVAEDWRLVYDSRTFAIRSIRNDDERKRWTEFMAEEQVPT